MYIVGVKACAIKTKTKLPRMWWMKITILSQLCIQLDSFDWINFYDHWWRWHDTLMTVRIMADRQIISKYIFIDRIELRYDGMLYKIIGFHSAGVWRKTELCSNKMSSSWIRQSSKVKSFHVRDNLSFLKIKSLPPSDIYITES